MIEDELLQRLLARRAEIERSLGAGVAKDYAEYRALTGEIAGLDFAREQMELLVRGREEDHNY